LIAEQPTRGLDVAAIEYVHNRLLQERERGAAILLISTDLDEIMTLSDRIAVIYEGQIVGIVRQEEADIHEIALLMTGGQRQSVGP
jgi:simple sugar transport system ATP-binding protein